MDSKEKAMNTEPEALVLSVPRAGALLGLGRSASYSAARRGDLPTIRIGRRLVVSRARLAELLGEPAETVARQ